MNAIPSSQTRCGMQCRSADPGSFAAEIDPVSAKHPYALHCAREDDGETA